LFTFREVLVLSSSRKSLNAVDLALTKETKLKTFSNWLRRFFAISILRFVIYPESPFAHQSLGDVNRLAPDGGWGR